MGGILGMLGKAIENIAKSITQSISSFLSEISRLIRPSKPTRIPTQTPTPIVSPPTFSLYHMKVKYKAKRREGKGDTAYDRNIEGELSGGAENLGEFKEQVVKAFVDSEIFEEEYAYIFLEEYAEFGEEVVTREPVRDGHAMSRPFGLILSSWMEGKK